MLRVKYFFKDKKTGESLREQTILTNKMKGAHTMRGYTAAGISELNNNEEIVMHLDAAEDPDGSNATQETLDTMAGLGAKAVVTALGTYVVAKGITFLFQGVFKATGIETVDIAKQRSIKDLPTKPRL